MIQLGYCCINTELASQGITTGRTMRKATFVADTGLVQTSQLALQNAKDLLTILQWNAEQNIWVFRMGSNLFPWNSEYVLQDLPDYEQIVAALQAAGTFAKSVNMRITAHPDHFVKLASLDARIVANSIRDLDHHDEVFHLMGLPANYKYCLNIHVGMNQSDDTTYRFLRGVDQLRDTTRSRLVVENDDKPNGYSILQLFRSLGDIPLTFDYFHHTFHTSNVPARDAAWMAAATWGTFTPLFHYSESKAVNENTVCSPRAHADYIYNRIDPYDLGIDIDVEAKAKEAALLQYRQRHPSSDFYSLPYHEYQKK